MTDTRSLFLGNFDEVKTSYFTRYERSIIGDRIKKISEEYVGRKLTDTVLDSVRHSFIKEFGGLSPDIQRLVSVSGQRTVKGFNITFNLTEDRVMFSLPKNPTIQQSLYCALDIMELRKLPLISESDSHLIDRYLGILGAEISKSKGKRNLEIHNTTRMIYETQFDLLVQLIDDFENETPHRDGLLTEVLDSMEEGEEIV